MTTCCQLVYPYRMECQVFRNWNWSNTIPDWSAVRPSRHTRSTPSFWTQNCCRLGGGRNRWNWGWRRSRRAWQRRVPRTRRHRPCCLSPELSTGSTESSSPCLILKYLISCSKLAGISQIFNFVVVLQLVHRPTRIKFSSTTTWTFPNLRIWPSPGCWTSHATWIDVIVTSLPLSPPETCGKRLSFMTNPRTGDHVAVSRRKALSPSLISPASAFQSTQLPQVPN